MKMTIGRITRTAMLAVVFMLCATTSAWAEYVAGWDFSSLAKASYVTAMTTGTAPVTWSEVPSGECVFTVDFTVDEIPSAACALITWKMSDNLEIIVGKTATTDGTARFQIAWGYWGQNGGDDYVYTTYTGAGQYYDWTADSSEHTFRIVYDHVSSGTTVYMDGAMICAHSGVRFKDKDILGIGIGGAFGSKASETWPNATFTVSDAIYRRRLNGVSLVSNGYTLNLTGSTLNDDGSITIAGADGLSVEFKNGDGFYNSRVITAVIEVSSLPTSGTLIDYKQDDGSDGRHVGLSIKNATTLAQSWGTSINATSWSQGYNDITCSTLGEKHTVAMAYNGAWGGGQTFVDGAVGCANKDGLYDSNHNLRKLYIGSLNGTSMIAAGMRVYSIKLYTNKLNASGAAAADSDVILSDGCSATFSSGATFKYCGSGFTTGFTIDLKGQTVALGTYPGTSGTITVNDSAGGGSATMTLPAEFTGSFAGSGKLSLTAPGSILPRSGGIDLSGNTLTIANASGTVVASDSITIGSSGLQIPLSANLPYHTIMMKVENIPSTASRLLGWAVNYGSVASSLDNYLSYTGTQLEQHYYYNGAVGGTTYGSWAWTRDASEHWIAISYAKDNNLGSQTAKGARSYLDGAEKVVGTGLNWPSLTTDKILVGGIALNGAEPATGMIVKDLHVYNDALTAGQVATVTAALNKGWTVGASGTALTSATLRELPGDYSVLVSGNMTVKSDGSLAFANGMSIKLPAEATLPYQIASSGNCWVDNVSLQIGDATPSTVTIRIEDGCIVGTATPRTISFDENLGSLGNGEKYFIHVTDDATVTIDQDVSAVGCVVFSVSAGKILKLDETAHSLDCPYEIISDPFSIAASATKTFTAGTAVEWYQQIGSDTTGDGAISSSGTTIAIANASSLSAGNYTLVRWVTPQKMSRGYGYVASLDTTGLAAGLTAELVYCVDRIVLRVYDTAAQAAKGTIKIMPYGDSITEGYNNGGTKANYRVLLAQKLSLAGYNVKMVGAFGKIQTDNGNPNSMADAIDPAGNTILPDWKWHSAKHGGTVGVTRLTSWQRSAMVENVDTLCAQAGTPDAVLLLGGINDLSPGFESPESVFANWKVVVGKLVANLPNTKILVATTLHASPARTDALNENADAFNTLVKNYMRKDAMPESWDGHVYLVDLCDAVKSADEGTITTDNLHPDWWGHNQMAQAWFEKIVELYPDPSGTFPSATVKTAPTSDQLGATNKTELASYRAGFTRYGVIEVGNNKSIDTVAYTNVDANAASEGLTKVGYFVEYVRNDNKEHRWVWVDMDAFGPTIGDVGLPTAKHQQVVTKLHVRSNHPGIENVAADDDSVTGWIEFTPFDYTGDSSGVSGAPLRHGAASGSYTMFDWDDTLSASEANVDSGTNACMQVFRKAPATGRPAQTLFAFNNWRSTTGAAEFGIGNFAQHFWGGQQTFDYTKTRGLEQMNASAYSVKTIEIWTKAVYTAEMSGNSNFRALTFSPTLPSDISECDLVVNVTDDATLTFDAEKSVGAITFNIAENKTLTLDGVSYLTVGEVIVAGPGKLQFSSSGTFGRMDVASSATLGFANGASLTVRGSLIVDSGATLSLYSDAIAAGGSSANLVSASSFSGNIAASDSLSSSASMLNTGTAIYLVANSSQILAYNAADGNWSADGFGMDFSNTTREYCRIGPDSSHKIVYEISSAFNPGAAYTAPTTPFTFCVYADVSKMSSEGNQIMMSFGNYTANNSGEAIILYRQGNCVRVGRFINGWPSPDWAASVPLAAGFHLYTVTVDQTAGVISLYRDGDVSDSNAGGSPVTSINLGAGFKFGSVYGSLPQNFALGTGMALSRMRAYSGALDSAQVAKLAESFPATDGTVIPGQINMTIGGATLRVYSSTYDAPTGTRNNYFGVSNGTLTIPLNETVNVSYLQCINVNNTGHRGTLNVEGTLNVTSASTRTDVYSDGGKGILLGHYHGQGTYNITGSLIGRAAYLDGCYTAEKQTINVDGGLLAVKGFSNENGTDSNMTIELTNGGTIEVAEAQTRGGSVRNFGRGTYKAAGNITDTKAINFNGNSVANATIIDPNGHTLSFGAAALTGNGYIKVASSVEEGEKGSVTFAGSAAGFTGTVVIDDVSKELITFTDITAYHGNILYAVTGSSALPSYLNGFAGTLTITGGPVDATGVDLSGATVMIANGGTFTATAGQEGRLVPGSGVSVVLKADNNMVNYEGCFPVIEGSCTVSYYNTDTGNYIANTQDDTYIIGNNLMPYYNVWVSSEDGNNNTIYADAAARWKLGSLPAANKNVAFKLNGNATVTIDKSITYKDIQVYGTGTLTIQQSDANVMTVTQGFCTTAGANVVVESGLSIGANARIEAAGALTLKTSQTLNVASSTGALTVGGSALLSLNANLTAPSLSLNDTAIVNIGPTVSLSATTLGVAGGATVNVSSGTTTFRPTSVSGAGTVIWTDQVPYGTAWKDCDSWTGTNIVTCVSVTTGNGLTEMNPGNWGHDGSFIKFMHARGYFANGSIATAEIVFEDYNGFALENTNGGSGSENTFNKISGTGTIKDVNARAAQTVYILDATRFSGSIDRTDSALNGGDGVSASSNYGRRYVFNVTATGKPTDSGGYIYVAANGRAVIGDGKSWASATTGGGIKIFGTVELLGAATMSGKVAIEAGSTLKLSGNTAQYLTIATDTTFTWPESGTVTVDVSACAPSAVKIPVFAADAANANFSMDTVSVTGSTVRWTTYVELVDGKYVHGISKLGTYFLVF